MPVQEVHIPALPAERFRHLIGDDRYETFQAAAENGRQLLAGRAVWNVNSTATGGGVAEMLPTLLGYTRGAGIDTRWMVIEGDPGFFQATKRLHNLLHGMPGDGGHMGPEERAAYDRVTTANAAELVQLVRRHDIVLLHDPQTAGLVHPLRAAGATVVWRSHIGTEVASPHAEEGWAFLRPYVEGADAYVFSRAAYAPPALVLEGVIRIIAPSIDPFTPKNQDLPPEDVRAILARVGVVEADGEAGVPTFTRYDGSPGRVDRPVLRDGATDPVPRGVPMVLQVSRWDRLKDMVGVMEGFAMGVAPSSDAHLVLLGPDVSGVADDPEGAEVLEECRAAWRELPAEVGARVHLVSVPMVDPEENAAVVNAAQRHAAVVAQKSAAEGFGLTVAEAMWKARPVVGSKVGGIPDQIVDGESGLLLGDATDVAAFGRLVLNLLESPDDAGRMGENARQRVVDHFLANRHLEQYQQLFEELVGRETP